MGWPKGRPVSEETKAKLRAAIAHRRERDPEAFAESMRKLRSLGNTPEAHRKRMATNYAQGTVAKCIAAMSASQARPDVRAKHSASRKALAATPDGRERILKTMIAGAQRPEVNERRKATSKAYAESAEGRAAKVRGGLAAMQSLRGASARKEWEYAGHRFRSSWERDFARFLDLLQVPWRYEPVIYTLSNGLRYVPDFRVSLPGGGEITVEVKGVRLGRGMAKYEAFVREHPDVRTMLISDEAIAAVRQICGRGDNGLDP